MPSIPMKLSELWIQNLGLSLWRLGEHLRGTLVRTCGGLYLKGFKVALVEWRTMWWLFCTKISHKSTQNCTVFYSIIASKQILSTLSRAQSSGAWLGSLKQLQKTFARISHNWPSSSSICWWKASGQSRRTTSVRAFLYCACGHCIYIYIYIYIWKLTQPPAV